MLQKKDLTTIKNFKKELSESIPVEKIILFGSRASGETNKWSDFDLLIVSKKFKGKKFRYRALGFYDHWKSPAPVDFLCYTPEEFQRMKKRVTLVNKAVEEGIEI